MARYPVLLELTQCLMKSANYEPHYAICSIYFYLNPKATQVWTEFILLVTEINGMLL